MRYDPLTKELLIIMFQGFLLVNSTIAIVAFWLDRM